MPPATLPPQAVHSIETAVALFRSYCIYIYYNGGDMCFDCYYQEMTGNSLYRVINWENQFEYPSYDAATGNADMMAMDGGAPEANSPPP